MAPSRPGPEAVAADPWTLRRELRAWERIARLGLDAARPGRGPDALVRRGRLVKELALRVGFDTTYWDSTERAFCGSRESGSLPAPLSNVVLGGGAADE